MLISGLGNMNPSPESIVGWLLEHQVDLTENNTNTEDESDETESVTDSFEDIDASGASEAVAIGQVTAIPQPEIYKKRSDFVNNDDYALYIRTHIQVGQTVKCCRTYEEVHEGDIGKVVKLDRDELHDLNVQVDWQRKSGTYWVRYIHVEILSNSSTLPRSVIKVGDRVRVKPSVQTPQYKWGSVNHTSVGVVTSISPNGRDVTVDFPMQGNWAGLLGEMELVPCCHPGVTCNGCGANPIAGNAIFLTIFWFSI